MNSYSSEWEGIQLRFLRLCEDGIKKLYLLRVWWFGYRMDDGGIVVRFSAGTSEVLSTKRTWRSVWPYRRGKRYSVDWYYLHHSYAFTACTTRTAGRLSRYLAGFWLAGSNNGVPVQSRSLAIEWIGTESCHLLEISLLLGWRVMREMFSLMAGYSGLAASVV